MIKNNLINLDNFIGKYWLYILLLISTLAIWALFIPGFFGVSDELHVAWLMEMDRTLKTGQFPPRFVPDLSFAFGYPLFNFVYPLPFYVGEIFHALGLSFVDSTKAVFLISAPLSAVFMYLFLRYLSSPFFSLMGALLYLFAPYRAVDIYVRGAIGEIVSFIFLPLLALSILKVTDEEETPKKILFWSGIGALTLGLLILSHNITSLMFIPFMAILALSRVIVSRRKKELFFILTFLGSLGLLISIYFWLPALLDSSLMKYDTVFNFIDHFPTLKQLAVPFWGYGASVPGPYDGLSFNIGVFQLGAVVLGIFFFFFGYKKSNLKDKVFFLWLLGSFLLCIFIMNFRSAFLWGASPLLPYFQFPWRFLIMTTFLAPIFVIFLQKVKFGAVIAFVLAIGAVWMTSTYFKPHEFSGRTDSYFANRYIPNPTPSSEYLKIQEEYLRLPNNTKMRPDANGGFITGNGFKLLETNKINDLHLELKVNTLTGVKDDVTIHYLKYYFPGWVAKIDGKDVEVKPGTPYGQITVKMPPGEHQVAFFFTETPFKLLLDLTSIVSLIIVSYMLWKSKISTKK